MVGAVDLRVLMNLGVFPDIVVVPTVVFCVELLFTVDVADVVVFRLLLDFWAVVLLPTLVVLSVDVGVMDAFGLTVVAFENVV